MMVAYQIGNATAQSPDFHRKTIVYTTAKTQFFIAIALYVACSQCTAAEDLKLLQRLTKAAAVAVPLDRTHEILETLADANKENHSRIRTWKCTVRDEMTWGEDQKLKYTVRNHSCLVDVQAGKILTKSVYDQKLSKDASSSVAGGTNGTFSVLITPDSYCEFAPDQKTTGFARLSKKRLPLASFAKRIPKDEMQPLILGSRVVDPMLFFSAAGRGSSATMLDALAEGFKENPKVSANVVRVGKIELDDMTVYSIACFREETHKPFSTFYISPDVSGNIVAIKQQDGLQILYEATFAKRGDVWLPARIEYERNDEVKHKVYVITTNSLNEPIEPSRFSKTAVGVPNNSYILDEVEECVYRVENRSWSKVGDLYDSVSTVNEAGYSISWSIVLNLLVASTLGIIVLRRWLMSGRGLE